MFISVEPFSSDRFESGYLAGKAVRGEVLDDATGLRWITTGDRGPLDGWFLNRVLTSGAAGLLCQLSEGYSFVPMEWLIEHGSGRTVLTIPDPAWHVTGPRVPDESDFIVQVKSSGEFVHLHCHSEFSPLDGLSSVKEIVNAAVQDNQPAIAITDHGGCASHPLLAKVAKSAGVKPIFGIEAYLVDHRQQKEKGTRWNYWHLVLLAQTDEGLRNLWAASTEAYRTGMFGVARMDWDTLARHSEGVICTTGCLRGPVADALRLGQDDLAVQRLGRLQAIYGDRLYVELHTNRVPDEPATDKRPARKGQVYVNTALADLAHQHSLPMVVVSDAHYACKDDHTAHQVWLSAATDRTLADEGDLFSRGEHYHIRSGDEIPGTIDYLPTSVVTDAMATTVTVAERCDAHLVERKSTPMYHRKGVAGVAYGHERDAEVLREMALASWGRKVTGKPGEERYRQQFEIEMDLLVSKKFCGYMLIEADICRFAKENGVLMGPGRGSAAGSLVCYLTGITEVDPIEADLLFERFLTPGRTSLPDIDSDFPASKRDMMIDYIIQRWGAEHVVRVGTHIRLKNRGVMRDVARVLKGTEDIDWRDVDAVSKLIESAEDGTAGLGLSWDELWAQHEAELAPYAEKYPLWFAYAEKLVGRLKSYGKHAAGVVIDPESPIIDRLPLRVGEDGEQPITEFDMEALELLGFVKFDILTLRTLDTIQQCIDLIRADPHYETAPDIYSWRYDEYADPEVWDRLCEGDTMGVFQIETTAGTRLTKDFQPRNMDDLCAILTLVRPGPTKSGLTKSYLRRRNGEEPVSFSHPSLEETLRKRLGAMIYQEDIMAVCRVLAGYSMEEADEVRSILGKKKVDKVAKEGERFVSRCLDHGVERHVAETLWGQMQEFAKYAFNRSHSWSYAMLAYWCAWLKVRYPAHFMVAVLSTVKKERIPDFVDMARRADYVVRPPDINESGHGFSISPDRVSIRYGLDSIKGIAEASLQAILQGQPYASFDDFLDRRGKACNMGHIKLLASLGCFDSIIPTHRASLEERIRQMVEGETDRCRWYCTQDNAHGLPCSFDWANEVVTGKNGRPTKLRPPPKKCTKACRNYAKADLVAWPEVSPLPPSIVRWREREVLGVFLSSTPFDEVMQALGDDVMTGSALDAAPVDQKYMVPVLITRVKKHTDKARREMAFVDGVAVDAPISMTLFSSLWTEFQGVIKEGELFICSVAKNDRGYSMLAGHIIPQQKEVAV